MTHTSLRAIALDLHIVRSRIASLGADAGENAGAKWDYLTDRRVELENEWRTMFQDVTGMSWSEAERAMS